MLGKLTVFILVAVGLSESRCPKCADQPDEFMCASDGKTYRTPCTVIKTICQKGTDLDILYPGTCLNYESSFPRATEPQPEIQYRPVDCSFWNLIPNAPCPKKRNMQCGNDLKNYGNICRMCRAGKAALNIRHKGRCTDFELALTGKSYVKREARREIQPLQLPRAPNCRNTFVPCSHVYGQMICASNGKTYSGECELCNRIREAEIRGQPMDVTITKIGGIC